MCNVPRRLENIASFYLRSNLSCSIRAWGKENKQGQDGVTCIGDQNPGNQDDWRDGEGGVPRKAGGRTGRTAQRQTVDSCWQARRRKTKGTSRWPWGLHMRGSRQYLAGVARYLCFTPPKSAADQGPGSRGVRLGSQ